MKKTNKAWVVVADAAGARLMECAADNAGRCRVKEYGVLRAITMTQHRGRPILTASNGHPASLQNHQAEEALRRFAVQLVKWILAKTTEHDIERLVLFAPPRFLGAMRCIPQWRLLPAISDRCGEFSSLADSDLARHPQIRALVVPSNSYSMPAAIGNCL